MRKFNFKIIIKDNDFIKYAFMIGVLLFSILFFRAYTSSFTYDESYTYVNYVKTDLKGIIRPLFTNGRILANNHFLNTFLISMLDIITGIKYNEFLIRLPNLFFYVVYLIFSYKIASKYRHKYLFFNLLVFNYGVHEFFGLARGYGMACSLTLIGLYFLKLWIYDIKTYNNLNICYYALLLSCYANSIGLIGFACVILFSQILILIKNSIKGNINYLKTQFIWLIPIFVALLIIIKYHFKISADGLPLYGGEGNFIDSVIVSGFNLYGFSKSLQLFATIIISCLILILACLKWKVLYKYGPQYLFFMYLVLLILLTKLSGKMWITGRELILLYPIFLFSLFEVIDKYKMKHKLIEILVACVVAIPFYYNLDISKTRMWADNYGIKADAYELLHNKEHISYNRDKKQKSYSYSWQFYRNKILYYYNYDIFDDSE